MGQKQIVFILICSIMLIIIPSISSSLYQRQRIFVEPTASNASVRSTIRNVIETSDIMNDTKMYFQQLRRNSEEFFPTWAYKNTSKTLKSFAGQNGSRGIVVCVGNGYFLLSLVALEALRSVGNKLPVEVVFSTSSDLSLTNQQILVSRFPEVQLVDLSTIFDHSYLSLRGFAIKPFSVLASRFQHVLLMDADAMFLEQPSTLFENELYVRTGSLFFYERFVVSIDCRRLLARMATITKNIIPRRAQDSGVVVIDKGRVLLGLLGICKLNERDQREKFTYKSMYGDKDTWWVGFQLVGTEYSFMPTLTGAIGQVRFKKVCGHILHFDQNDKPIWWNGGTFKNRYVNMHEILQIEGWLEEGEWSGNIYSCVSNSKRLPKLFMEPHRSLIENYINITKQIFNISARTNVA